MVQPKDETYSEEETEARREAALRRMLQTPPKPHNEAGLILDVMHRGEFVRDRSVARARR